MTQRFITDPEQDQVIPPTSRKVFVALDERGRRMGETHQHAILSDAEVDQIRDMRELYDYPYLRIAELMHCSMDTIRSICLYRRRATSISRWYAVIVHTAKEG